MISLYMALHQFIKNRFFKQREESSFLQKGEILAVFVIGFFMALSLWFLVNLSREYSLNIQIPLVLEPADNEMAFLEMPPEFARVGVSGEGWYLFPLYRNPPKLPVRQHDGVVRVSDMVHDYLASYPGISVQDVDPQQFTIRTEPRVSKRVPVQPVLDLRYESRYERAGELRISPDSVTLSGAASVLSAIENWPTERLQLRNVRQNVSERVSLLDSGGLFLKDTLSVHISFEVTEYVEGEIRVYVRARNMPEGQQIRFNPSIVSLRYEVPIFELERVQELVPFRAWIDYQDIQSDTTGTLEPVVEATEDDLQIRLVSVQPARVSWFRVID